MLYVCTIITSLRSNRNYTLGTCILYMTCELEQYVLCILLVY